MAQEISVIVPWLIGGLLLLILLINSFFNVSGTWERVASHEEQQALAERGLPPPREQVVLAQFAFFVTGRRELPGGYQEFSGLIFLGRLRLSRRDHGLRSLTQQGFPEPIAKNLIGQITAKLQLRLTMGGEVLDGVFVPFKVEFTHQPPKITQIYPLASQRRRYRRLTAEELVVEPSMKTLREEQAS